MEFNKILKLVEFSKILRLVEFGRLLRYRVDISRNFKLVDPIRARRGFREDLKE